jgi:hypothetical protein
MSEVTTPTAPSDADSDTVELSPEHIMRAAVPGSFLDALSKWPQSPTLRAMFETALGIRLHASDYSGIVFQAIAEIRNKHETLRDKPKILETYIGRCWYDPHASVHVADTVANLVAESNGYAQRRRRINTQHYEVEIPAQGSYTLTVPRNIAFDDVAWTSVSSTQLSALVDGAVCMDDVIADLHDNISSDIEEIEVDTNEESWNDYNRIQDVELNLDSSVASELITQLVNDHVEGGGAWTPEEE